MLTQVGLDPAYAAAIRTSSPAASASASASRARWRSSPSFIVCDEAVAALDVSIQAQVAEPVHASCASELGLTYLFISHDLAVVAHLSDRVAIMYLGRIVETAPARRCLRRPNHPYTQALLAEVPPLDAAPAHLQRRSPASSPRRSIRRRLRLPPALPARLRPLQESSAPPIREVATGHFSACHLNDG